MKTKIIFTLALIIFALTSCKIFSQNFTQTQRIMYDNQTVLTTYLITDLDSAVTFTPTIDQYFDASLYMDPNDSTLISLTVDGETDSARVILVGAYDNNNKGVAIDTIATNKTTLMQSQAVVTEVGKYQFPFWGFIVQGIDLTDATVRIFIYNVKKITQPR